MAYDLNLDGYFNQLNVNDRQIELVMDQRLQKEDRKRK